jgi:hypothetical protein
MPGILTPLVLVPRYTTLSGTFEFSTIALDVTAYQNAIVNLFRTALLGTGGAVKFNLEESTDQVIWTVCSGTTADFDITPDTETQDVAALTKRWFRLTIQLPNANNVSTFYVVGFLEERES